MRKKAHNETDIADNAVSVSYAAVELSKKVFGKIDNKQALIIGAGDMSELSLLNLIGSGVTDITVVNRTLSKAQKLAMKHHVKFESMESLPKLLANVDIVISSTSSDEYIVTNDMMRSISTERKSDSLVLIDIAVPRDIEPNINTVQDVFNYDVDDLKGLVDANLRERQIAANDIMQRIPGEIVAHNEWVSMLGVVPVIRALREKAMNIQEDTMNSIDRKLPALSERERKIISKHTKSIINQMLKDPIKQAKELSNDRNSNEKLELFQNIFDIEAEQAYEPKKRRSEVPTSQILSFE